MISVTQTDIDAGCLFLGACIFIAAMRQGFKTMASAIEQVGQALAGAHSAALEQLEADIQLAATQLAAKDATIATLTAQVADLTAQLAAATPVGTSDADLGTLDALLKPALDAVAPTPPPAATATPVTVPDNPPVNPGALSSGDASALLVK